MEQVEGKTAFVTGGASRIGLGMATAFVTAGMNVVIADLRQNHIETALESFEDRGARDQVHAIELVMVAARAARRARSVPDTTTSRARCDPSRRASRLPRTRSGRTRAALPSDHWLS